MISAVNIETSPVLSALSQFPHYDEALTDPYITNEEWEIVWKELLSASKAILEVEGEHAFKTRLDGINKR